MGIPHADMEPINALASRVIRPGTHFEPIIKPHTMQSADICPPVWGGHHANKVKLAGRRFGRFVVIGLSLDRRGRWVVRCDCGKFEFRTAKAIWNPENKGDRCMVCRKLLHFQEWGAIKEKARHATD